jgi:hypothetical protein
MDGHDIAALLRLPQLHAPVFELAWVLGALGLCLWFSSLGELIAGSTWGPEQSLGGAIEAF